MLAELGALTRAKMRASLSYRLQTALSFFGLVVSVVPIYFVATALQPVMARSIAAEGGQYFGFLVVGMIMISMVNTCVNVLSIEVGAAIGTGTLEALLATPTRRKSWATSRHRWAAPYRSCAYPPTSCIRRIWIGTGWHWHCAAIATALRAVPACPCGSTVMRASTKSSRPRRNAFCASSRRR